MLWIVFYNFLKCLYKITLKDLIVALNFSRVMHVFRVTDSMLLISKQYLEYCLSLTAATTRVLYLANYIYLVPNYAIELSHCLIDQCIFDSRFVTL